MPLSKFLEDFSDAAVEDAREVTEVALEDEKLDAFENGYKAGWEDCNTSQKESIRQISADLSQNLGDLSFTYQEAYAACMAAIAPVLEQMVHSVLPELARKSLGLRVIELLQTTAQQHGTPQVEIRVAPVNMPTVEACMPDESLLPVKLIEERTLADGQIHLRFGQAAEHEIDMTTVLAGLEDALASFFHEVQPQMKEYT